MSRYFVAVRPPEPALAMLDDVPRPVIDGVRWTPREQLHVTVAFLGDIRDAGVVAALRTLAPPGATARLGPAIATLRDQVIIVPVAGLDGLAGAVADAVRPLAPGMATRRFRGHLTLGRARRGLPDGVVGRPVDARFDVSELELVSSRLDSTGATHTVVARFAVG